MLVRNKFPAGGLTLVLYLHITSYKYIMTPLSSTESFTGLDRCGKSCRRRWMNHLRPDLKRGKFSMDEINLIIQLQEALGNRWSDIASHLDGRTDNDVKNLWNTQIKKRLAQLKASQDSCCSNISSPNNRNTYATSSTSNIYMSEKMNQMSNPMTGVQEFLESHDDDGLVIRFDGTNVNGLQDCSCSASSCDGHNNTAGDSNYDKENSSSYWKPANLQNVNLKPHENNGMYLSFGPNHGGHNIINQSAYSNRLALNKFNTECEAVDHQDSLRVIGSYSSRTSSINNPADLQMAPDFLHQPELFAADNDDGSSAANTTLACDMRLPIFDNHGGNHFNAGTPTALRPTNSCQFNVLENDSAATGRMITINNNDKCCSLISSPNHIEAHTHHAFDYPPHTSMSKTHPICPSNDVFNLPDNFKCSPNPNKGSHNLPMNTSSGPGLQISNCFTENLAVMGSNNYLQSTADGRWAFNMSRSAAGNYDYVPGSVKISDTQGWDIVGEMTCGNNTALPQFSLPDWCKHVLQGDLL